MKARSVPDTPIMLIIMNVDRQTGLSKRATGKEGQHDTKLTEREGGEDGREWEVEDSSTRRRSQTTVHAPSITLLCLSYHSIARFLQGPIHHAAARHAATDAVSRRHHVVVKPRAARPSQCRRPSTRCVPRRANETVCLCRRDGGGMGTGAYGHDIDSMG